MATEYKIELNRRGIPRKADITKVKKLLLANRDTGNKTEFAHKYTEPSVITQITKHCRHLQCLDHGIQNLNSEIDYCRNIAKEAHYYALRIKGLIPKITPRDYEVAEEILKGLDTAYLNVLADRISYDCPGGFWWRYLYKEITPLKEAYMQAELEASILQDFDLGAFVKESNVLNFSTVTLLDWEIDNAYDEYRNIRHKQILEAHRNKPLIKRASDFANTEMKDIK